MILENLINILTMLFSIIAIVLLVQLSIKVGGSVGKILKLIVAGIFFSTIFHQIFGFLSTYGFISHGVFESFMGTLLGIGSILFIIAGVVGIKEFK
jgi:hypothetical protein